jgi:glycosyltransferase involved in cell wall biosynthesis
VAIEAMACGRPVVAATWDGDEVLDASVGWPIPIRLAPVPREASGDARLISSPSWAVTDVDVLAEALSDACARPHEAAERGRRGPERVAAHDHRAVARTVLDLLGEIEPRLESRPPSPRPAVAIEGAISGTSSLAGINRELARALQADGGLDVGLVDIGPRASTEELGPLSRSLGGLLPSYPHVTVHHAHPPEFLPRSPGRSVQIAHWEYGPPPADWAELVRTRVDEVWVSSTWVRDWFLRAGMDPDKVVVVPLGVDHERFHPEVQPLDLGDAAPGFRFLFVGGLVWRKGADLIASAFGDAFTESDDVTLVIKTYGVGGPYVSDGCDLLIERLRATSGGPRVHMITGDMDEADMPGLYAACDCLVHPYRGEAFGMTMLEAMACGLPVVMPDMGAARDFADAETALLVPARTLTIPSLDAPGQRMTEYPVVVDMDSGDLAARLRWAFEHRQEARAIGAAAARHVADGWTWHHVVRRVTERVEALAGAGVPA